MVNFIKTLWLLYLSVTILIIASCKTEKPPKPPAVSGPSSENTNISVTFTVTTTDPNKDDVAYLFNWGDGTRDSWSIFFASGQTVYKSHTFRTPGNYDVVAKAKDEKGNESEWSAIHRIAISSQPPNIPVKPSGPQSARVNATVSFSTSTTDPDGDSIAYKFDWGDGSELTWTGYYKSGTTVTQSHIFTSPGSFNVKVKAKDKNDVESNWSEPFSITITTSGWITIMEEDFEGVFPGSTWTLYGSPTWDDESYRYYQGSWSGWCAGSTRTPPGPYASNMNAWMVFGPFSLADASDAVLSFYRWLYSESGYDYLFWGASIDGTNFYGYRSSGDYRSWSYREFDLTSVPTLGNLCGYSRVWIGFKFSSDGIVQYEGAYLDNIYLKKYVGFNTSRSDFRPKRSPQPVTKEALIPCKERISENLPRSNAEDLKCKEKK